MPNESLAELRIRELLVLIGSDSIAPGAGAAGAVALALASACAAKAVSISLKHSPQDARLAASLSDLERIRGLALREADADARAFAEFLSHKDPGGADALIETGEETAGLINALIALIDQVQPHVAASMGGDLVAAKSLAAAAREIQSTNEAEAKKARRAMTGGSARQSP